MGLGSILNIFFNSVTSVKILSTKTFMSEVLGVRTVIYEFWREHNELTIVITTVISMPHFGKHFNVNVISRCSEFG